jgi:hypothetical protein
MTNSWLIRRDVDGLVIIVQAHHIPKADLWGLTCKVNGIMVDHNQAEEPISEALNMVEAAILEHDNETRMPPELARSIPASA